MANNNGNIQNQSIRGKVELLGVNAASYYHSDKSDADYLDLYTPSNIRNVLRLSSSEVSLADIPLAQPLIVQFEFELRFYQSGLQWYVRSVPKVSPLSVGVPAK